MRNNAEVGYVDYSILEVATGKVIHFGQTPREAGEFSENYDWEYPVSPFRFEIDIPEELLKNCSSTEGFALTTTNNRP